jgi:hypothetical protein
MELSQYKSRLFDLLPQLYQIYDKGDGSLEKFLEDVGETLDDMELNIAELYDDSFIESCHEWVIPYIGRLIGARLLESEGDLLRREVMHTIAWRKRKGNLSALEDLAGQVTGWGVRAAEFFEQLGWSQNLNHIKADHLQSPNLRNHKALFGLGGAENVLLHNVDVRKPCGAKGWFQIRNIGFFLSTKALARYGKIPLRQDAVHTERFSFDPRAFPFDLFDGESGFPLSQSIELCERFQGFGTGRTVDVFSGGVLAATPEMPPWTGLPAMLPTDPLLLNLRDGTGLAPVDWTFSGGEPLPFIITPMVLYENNAHKATLKELGKLDLTHEPLSFVKTFDGSSKTKGRLIIRVAGAAGHNASFPGMVLRLESAGGEHDVFKGITSDRTAGIYKDRMYCYLPAFCPSPGLTRDFVIDRYGSAYHYTHDGTKSQPHDERLYSFTLMARITEGIIYPSRQLTASTSPCRMIYSLDKNNPLTIVDRGQFLASLVPAAGWTIRTWNRDVEGGGGMVRLLTSATITSLSDKARLTIQENHSFNGRGHLVISLHRSATSTKKIPQMEVVVIGERGESIIVYLPQIDDMEASGAFFYVADDGATYKVNGDTVMGGIIVPLPPVAGPEGAFTDACLARYSAGQVLPQEGISPIRHLIPVRCNLSEGGGVQPGLLAIDPEAGLVAFAETETPGRPVSASCYHGLSGYVGAGPWFHNWESVEEKRLIRVSKNIDPAGKRHLRPVAVGVFSTAAVFVTLTEAIDEVNRRSRTTDPGKPWIIRIEDSAVYHENLSVPELPSCGLIIRAAEFQRPFLDGRVTVAKITANIIDSLSFEGLTIGGTVRIRGGRYRTIRFIDCTCPGTLLIYKAVTGEGDRYGLLAVERCILRRHVMVNGFFEVRIADSALDPIKASALIARHSTVIIDGCTVTGGVRVKELEASESIFLGKVTVVNPQKGCIRYSRINPEKDTLPYRYRCTTAPVTFCGRLPWRSDYLKLRRACGQPVSVWAENGGEIGVYRRAGFTLKAKNLMLKFDEYLPVGLTPVLIDECGAGNGPRMM